MVAAEIIRAPLACRLVDKYRGAVAVIGNMDGVHRGHQALVRAGVDMAVASNAPAAVVTFEPHPRRVFQPDAPPFLLTRLSTKARVLGALGIEFLLTLPFIEDLYRKSPAEFVAEDLQEILGLAGIVTGEDFRFGSGRTGDAPTLAGLANAAGITARIISPVADQGSTEKISSSAVRTALSDGDPGRAMHLLGRPWSIEGEVMEGRRLARTLDFPTANVPLGAYLRPKFGVYAITANVGGALHKGVANIGVRPTVDGKDALLEAHLFDFDEDLYGRTIDVSILEFLRPEQRFEGLDALKAQIAADVGRARHFHGAAPA